MKQTVVGHSRYMKGSTKRDEINLIRTGWLDALV